MWDGGSHRSCSGQPCCMRPMHPSRNPACLTKLLERPSCSLHCFLLVTLPRLLASANDVGVSVGDQLSCLSLCLCVSFEFACFCLSASVSGCPSLFFCLCIFLFPPVFLPLDPHNHLCLFMNLDISVCVSLHLSISVSLCCSVSMPSRCPISVSSCLCCCVLLLFFDL